MASFSLAESPRFTGEDAVRLASRLFEIDGATEPLPSERDQNFLMTAGDGARYVLKIANAGESPDILEMQNRAIGHLAQRVPGLAWPRVIGAIEQSGAHYLRLLTWVDGVPLARARPHSPALLRSLGRALATIADALNDFAHPALEREFQWDLRHAGAARDGLSLVSPSRRPILEPIFDRWAGIQWAGLRCSAIHGDPNDHNVLVDLDATPDRGVVSIVDFGDMVRSAAICDLAIAIAYVMLGKPDPVSAAAEVVRGYHAVRPLTEDEADVLWTLAETRLAMSVCHSARQSREAPENSYLNISRDAAWELIERLPAIPRDWPLAVLRHVCGFTAIRSGSQVRRFLADCEIAPVIQPDPRSAPSIVYDLSVESRVGFSNEVFDVMREAGVEIGIGRYNEARRAYFGEQYIVPSNDFPERRTIHIGLDLFQPAGSAVYAPIEGRVHSFADNNALNDYGPTIILEHRAGGEQFFTLFGHLSRNSLVGLEPGQEIARGQQIATLGDESVNGGWPPHLHFQIMLSMLGRKGEFPGVAAPSWRNVWLDLCPDPNLLVRIPSSRFPAERPDFDRLLAARRARLGPSLSLSYRSPLHIVRGEGVHLFDHQGQAYLDCVNNVAHVGHSHPKVVQALDRQAALLNTNTRYLHHRLVEYLERLAATLPEPLSVIYLVCSGSEANELALRLARAHTGREEFIVLDAAYHGNTNALIDISPYKFNGRGGRGKPSHVRVVPLPDRYRGIAYEGTVAAAARSGSIAAFIAESAPGCGGQIILPAGYLRDAYSAVREAGGVTIADEVQTGFGRAGSHFWMFETQGVVPDIVTLGKPIGNGHPMGAVITTPEIARSFANGMEYFNTFGGNPVSCAVGLAVLDVIRDERLQENARDVGAYFLARLEEMKPRHPLIGDVRGHGLYLGIELVLDRKSKEPAGDRASWLVERMRERGILLSTDGPFHNVIKIKPPLVFSRADVDRVISNLDVVLHEDCFRQDCFRKDT